MMVYVLLKQTFDTEEKVILQDGKISEEGVRFIINPYDEYAVEEAIRIKEKLGGTVIVISVGPDRCAEALRAALAMGADEAVLIHQSEGTSDEYCVSNLLAAYFTDQDYDLILGGNFSVDNGAGQVAIRLAELLGIPHVASITKLSVDNNKLATVERDAEGDLEQLEVELPALFTAQQGLNEPRYPSLPGIMKAKKKPFLHIQHTELELSEEQIKEKITRVNLQLPPARVSGRILEGDLTSQVAELVQCLHLKSKR